MEIRVCPECNKAFYTTVEISPTCHHCGHILLDRRTRKRTKTKTDFTFYIEGIEREATLIDFSKYGARIICSGDAFSVNTILDLKIDEHKIHETAKAVWMKKRKESRVIAGLKFL